jgi:hypothetical protein
VVCNDKIEHYYNRGHRSSLLDSNNPTIGITNANVEVIDTSMNCTFTRKNNIDGNDLYFDINNQNPIIMIAYGRGKINLKKIFFFL